MLVALLVLDDMEDDEEEEEEEKKEECEAAANIQRPVRSRFLSLDAVGASSTSPSMAPLCAEDLWWGGSNQPATSCLQSD